MNLEGRGDLVSRLITPISHIVTLVILILNLLTRSPDPPSTRFSMLVMDMMGGSCHGAHKYFAWDPPSCEAGEAKTPEFCLADSHILLRESEQRFFGYLRATMEAKLQEWLRSFCAGLQGSILPRLSRTCVVCLLRREARSNGHPDTIGTTSHVVS